MTNADLWITEFCSDLLPAALPRVPRQPPYLSEANRRVSYMALSPLATKGLFQDHVHQPVFQYMTR